MCIHIHYFQGPKSTCHKCGIEWAAEMLPAETDVASHQGPLWLMYLFSYVVNIIKQTKRAAWRNDHTAFFRHKQPISLLFPFPNKIKIIYGFTLCGSALFSSLWFCGYSVRLSRARRDFLQLAPSLKFFCLFLFSIFY